MRWFLSRRKTSRKQPPPSDRTIVVQVLKGAGDKAALKINQDDVTWENLEGRLNDIFKTRAEKVMFVKADPELPFNDVAQVIDIAHSAGVDKVGVDHYNRHMQECNRVIEAQLSGRSSPATLEASDALDELTRIRGELDNLDGERKVLKAKLEEKEKLVDTLLPRLSALEKSGLNASFVPPGKENGANGQE